MRASWLALLALLVADGFLLCLQELLPPQLLVSNGLVVSTTPFLLAFGATALIPAAFTNFHTFVWCVALSCALALAFALAFAPPLGAGMQSAWTLRSVLSLGSR